jgi:[lysine-biosynthesis-protein LysW]--L-2-aminoadipate ligase
VDIPDRMVDFCLRVVQDGWAAANGWSNGELAFMPVSLTGED